jgi:hypothetical protein
LLATNQQAKQEQENKQQQMSMAEHMHQTTLTQCFNPPIATAPAPPPAPASGYRCMDINGKQYLLKKGRMCVGQKSKESGKSIVGGFDMLGVLGAFEEHAGFV